MALRSAAVFSMFVYILLPIAFVGGGTAELVSGYLYPQAMDEIIGSTRVSRTSSSSVSASASSSR